MQEKKSDKASTTGWSNRTKGVTSVKLQGPFVYAEFLKRPNRFLAICKLKGQRVPVYIPNPGPMPDLLFPGVEVLLRHNPGVFRKTDYDLICSRKDGVLLSLDSRVPNWLLAEALPKRQLPPFAQYSMVQTEPVYGDSRLDFLLQSPGLPPCLIEAKSSTDAENSIGHFPRAVTDRGQRHLRELMHAITCGYRAAIVFVVQRTDAKQFRPNDRIDPVFGQVLREASSQGVEPYAWTTRFDEKKYEITIAQQIPVDLTVSMDCEES